MNGILLNQALKFVAFLRKIYWFVFTPITVGVKVIIRQGDGVLLVKNRYESYWCFPGGGVQKRETPREAIERELREECGIDITEFTLLGVYSNFSEYKNDYIILFEANLDKPVNLHKGIELEACAFFELKNLPATTSKATRKRIDELRQEYFGGEQW